MSIYFKKLKSINSQSLVEYTLVIILVTASIITMGPYVKRSWNANIKSLDDSVTDSVDDQLIQPGTTADTTITSCTCVWQAPQACRAHGSQPIADDPNGGGCCGGVDCGPQEQIFTWTCSPLGCDTAVVNCVNHVDCCSDWDDTIPGNPTCGADATNIPVPPSVAGECPDGSSEKVHFCGDGIGATTIPFYKCETDGACTFACNIINPVFATMCDGDDSGLAASDNGSHDMVPPGSCGGPKCEYECMAGFVEDTVNTDDCACSNGNPRSFPFYTCTETPTVFNNPTVGGRVISHCDQNAARQFCIDQGLDDAYPVGGTTADSDDAATIAAGYPWGSAPCNTVWSGTQWVELNCLEPVPNVCYSITCTNICP